MTPKSDSWNTLNMAVFMIMKLCEELAHPLGYIMAHSLPV